MKNTTPNTHTSESAYTDTSTGIVLHAQPYDLSANGFFFESYETFRRKAAANRNDLGHPVEEYELQFIDGDELDSALFRALGVHQANVKDYLRACTTWGDDEKRRVIIAVGEAGYAFDLTTDTPDDLEVDIYEMDSLRELAEHFVDEGLFGPIPESIAGYLDYDAIARDLSMDYAELSIAGSHYIYRCC